MTINEFCTAYGKGHLERWWRQEWIDAKDKEPIDIDTETDLGAGYRKLNWIILVEWVDEYL